MSDPSLALQGMIHARLIADSATTTLVPAANILDRNHRPEAYPSILIGAGSTTFGDNIQDSFHDTAFVDLHIWTQETGLETAKSIAGAVKNALRTGPWAIENYRAVNVRCSQARYLRDPELSAGPIAHVVLTVQAILQELT